MLALNPDGTVRGTSKQYAMAVGVTGALVAELVHDGHLALDEGRIRLTGTEPLHPLLVRAFEGMKPYEGKRLKTKLGSIKHAGWSEVVDFMIGAGVLSRDKQAFRATRHPVLDPGSQDLLLGEVRSAAVGEGSLDRRMATLLALAGPCQMLEVVAPSRGDRPMAKRRIKEAAEQVPGRCGRQVRRRRHGQRDCGRRVASSSFRKEVLALGRFTRLANVCEGEILFTGMRPSAGPA